MDDSKKTESKGTAAGTAGRTDFQADEKQSDRRTQRIPRHDTGHPRADMFGHNTV